MSLPDINCYKDINADTVLPDVTMSKALTYLRTFDKDIDKTCIDFYSSGFVNFVRVAFYRSCFYIRAETRAAMKVAVTYVVDISIDSNGIVAECQCECGAGMGPTAHCKHVAMILYGLTKFRQTHEFVTAQTCTERLQTFHQAKKHLGSPRKTAHLHTSISDDIDFDPRPPEFIHQVGYSTYFQNLCINSAAFSDAPVAQCFMPASIFGVMHDHSYCTSQDPTDKILKDLKVSEISEHDITCIERATLRQSENEMWLKERQKRLNSSSFGRICKRTSKTDSQKMARSMLSTAQINSRSLAHGRLYESVAVSAYERYAGVKTTPCGLFVCKQYPFLAASPGRVINADLLVEVKCPFVARDYKITPQTIPYLKNQNDVLALDNKHDYYYQVQGQMLCTGAKAVDFVVFTFKDLYVCRVNREDAFISDMVAELTEFYEHYFKLALFDRFVAKNYFTDVICHCEKQLPV
jgi:hypothetical protein